MAAAGIGTEVGAAVAPEVAPVARKNPASPRKAAVPRKAASPRRAAVPRKVVKPSPAKKAPSPLLLVVGTTDQISSLFCCDRRL